MAMKNQLRSFVFWKNLLRKNLLVVLYDLYHHDPWGISRNVNNFFGLFATHLFINSRSDMNLSGNDILVARVPSREGEVYDVRGFESDMSEAIMHAQVRIKLFS